MARLSYLLRGTGNDDVKKTVVVRFTHGSQTFDKVSEVKATKKNFDQKAGLVKIKVKGSAEENKKTDLVRSRFQDTLKRMESPKLSPSVE